MSKNNDKGVEVECGEGVERIKLIGRHVKNSVGGEVCGGKVVEISGGVSTKYCFKMWRYVENKVEGGVRKGAEMMPEKRSGNDAQRMQWGKSKKKRVKGEEDSWRIPVNEKRSGKWVQGVSTE